MEKTFKEFKQENIGGYCLIAAEDVPGFYKKGSSMYGNCDDMIVVDYLYQPLNGVYTVYLANRKGIEIYKNEDQQCECWKCEIKENCICRDKYQRLPRTNKGALGLCPKLKK